MIRNPNRTRSIWTLLVVQATLLAAAIVGCTRPPLPGATPSPGSSPASTPSPLPPTETVVPTPAPIVLRVWVPPEFDPGAGSPQAILLQERLDEFTARDPDVRIEVRVKALEGEGGLLASLTAAHTVAPLALPDLVALPQEALEVAALKGLLNPINELTTVLGDQEWYDYARKLVRVQTDDFGLPFAGDAMLLIYRPALVSEPPLDWDAALGLSEPLAFPAASPQALFPLSLYLASGGAIQDAEGRPSLDVAPLTAALTFLQSGERAGLIPVWLSQYDSQDLAMQAFLENRAHMAVTWTSDYLADPPPDAAPATLPMPQANPFTLATGWVWALSSPQPDRLGPSIRLAEFLTDSEFLGRWTAAAGYLPPSPAALEAWPVSSFRALLSQIVLSADVVPPQELLTIIGPTLQQATLDVLKGLETPETTAQEAAESLQAP